MSTTTTATKKRQKKETALGVGQIRTDDPEGTRFQVLRVDHSTTTPRLLLYVCFLVFVIYNLLENCESDGKVACLGNRSN
ncbi:hypothetical protein BDV95DRAFT_583346 [Massariosphaeria phaeospora]|uniref:Uncharacterized protein n=1 Tax=Massariosphaeria phaeospora TaxID=100035 RepID=A0A7C8M390_9PLEO|nr:hypothetical protein BDV95DRAFT_583346 [Massariosphaeria phaeospora]